MNGPETDATNEKVKEIMQIFNGGKFDKAYNRQVILEGPPGTSKTYISKIVAAKLLGYDGDDYKGAKDYLEGPPETSKTCISEIVAEKPLEYDGDDNKDEKKYLEKKERFELIQFHPSYTYEDFVRGITVSSEGTGITYKSVNKVLGEIASKANEAYEKNKEKAANYVLIIDEINRAPLASVLGELIYALEYRGEEISIPYKVDEEPKNYEKSGKIIIPPNLFIIGTMNTADRSIGSIDYAVRRRFAFVRLDADETVIKGSWGNESLGESIKNLFAAVKKLIKRGIADDTIDPTDIEIGHAYFMGKEDVTDEIAYFNYRWRYQIIPIIKEYVKDGLLKDEIKQLFEGEKSIDKKIGSSDSDNIIESINSIIESIKSILPKEIKQKINEKISNKECDNEQN